MEENNKSEEMKKSITKKAMKEEEKNITNSEETVENANTEEIKVEKEKVSGESEEIRKVSEQDTTSLKEEIEILKNQVEEFKSKWIYTYSEFENYRKRVRTEIQNEVANAVSKVISNFAGALDAIDSAIAYIKDENVKKGIELIKNIIEEALIKSGVRKIDVKEGDIFSPNFCEVVDYEENPNLQDGTIIKVLRNGLEFQGRVIRAAQVIVSKYPQKKEDNKYNAKAEDIKPEVGKKENRYKEEKEIKNQKTEDNIS